MTPSGQSDMHSARGGSSGELRSRIEWVLRGAFLSPAARLRAFWHFIARRYGYEICMVCGRPVGRFFASRSYWTTSDDLWLRVTGDPHSVYCSSCFTRTADDKGIHVRWEAREGFGEEAH